MILDEANNLHLIEEIHEEGTCALNDKKTAIKIWKEKHAKEIREYNYCKKYGLDITLEKWEQI